VTGILDGDAPAVFVGQVLLVPDLICADLGAVVLGHRLDEIAKRLGLRRQAVLAVGRIEAGRLDDIDEQLEVMRGDIVDDLIKIAPCVGALWPFDILPDHLLAHPIESGNAIERQHALAVGVV
jgi:hypothetical protein